MITKCSKNARRSETCTRILRTQCSVSNRWIVFFGVRFQRNVFETHDPFEIKKTLRIREIGCRACDEENSVVTLFGLIWKKEGAAIGFRMIPNWRKSNEEAIARTISARASVSGDAKHFQTADEQLRWTVPLGLERWEDGVEVRAATFSDTDT